MLYKKKICSNKFIKRENFAWGLKLKKNDIQLGTNIIFDDALFGKFYHKNIFTYP